MKRLFSILIFMLAIAHIFASSYKVRSYSFDVKGKTKTASLLEFLGSTDRIFETQEKLDNFLKDKQQQLINKRVFNQVEFTYELQETGVDVFEADVVFQIVDASTFLIVPYPKYDSNYGLNLKLKAKDSNFLGTFTSLDSTLAFTQRNNTFKDGKLEWDFSVDSMRIKNAKLSFSHSGAMDFLTWTESFLGGSASISDVKFWDVSVNGSFSFKFSPKGTSRNSRWGGREIGSSIGIKFLNPKLDNASISNTIKYTFNTEKFETSTSFSYMYSVETGITGMSSFETVQYGFENGLSTVRIGTGASKKITPLEKLSFSPSFWVYLKYTFASSNADPYLALTIPVEYGRIDWIGDNNFRKGVLVNVSGIDEYHVFEKTYLPHKLKLQGYLQFHYPVTSWFNPSARFNFIIANEVQEIKEDDVFSWNMRGIRDANPVIEKERAIRITFNLDLMFNFIRIRDFCRTYAIGFTDFFIGSNEDGSFDRLMTVGAEGIVILDSHPSYPIRGSLGFNAEHLLKFIKGEMDIKDVEFELYIGLYFFY